MTGFTRRMKTFKLRERGEKDKFTTVRARTKAEAALKFTTFKSEKRKRRPR